MASGRPARGGDGDGGGGDDRGRGERGEQPRVTMEHEGLLRVNGCGRSVAELRDDRRRAAAREAQPGGARTHGRALERPEGDRGEGVQARRGGPQRADERAGLGATRSASASTPPASTPSASSPSQPPPRAGPAPSSDAKRGLGAAGRPDRAGGERPQAAGAGRRPGEPGDEQRQPDGVERERGDAERGAPALARRLEAALRARAAQQRRARVIASAPRAAAAARGHEGSAGGGAWTHILHRQMSAGSTSVATRSSHQLAPCPPRRSRAKRSRLRLSDSRSARRMNSASVSGVNDVGALELVLELERDLDAVAARARTTTRCVPRSFSSSTSSVCPARAS